MAGTAALVAFVAVESRSPAPMLPLPLFRNHNFAGANLLTLLLYAALGGGLYFFPLNLIQVQGYSATEAGAALLPFILIMFVGSRWAGQLVDRTGPKLPLTVGPFVAAAGFALFALPGIGGSYWTGWFPAVVVLGLGMTITVSPLTTTVMNAVGVDLAGVASGVNNAVSRTAAVLAIAVFGLVMAGAFNDMLDTQLQALNLPQQVHDHLDQERGKLAAASVPPGLGESASTMLKQAIGLAYVAGFRWVMAVCAGLAVLAGLSAMILIEGRTQPVVSRA